MGDWGNRLHAYCSLAIYQIQLIIEYLLRILLVVARKEKKKRLGYLPMAPTTSPNENSEETNCYRNVQYGKTDIQIEITRESLWKDTEENGQCIFQNREKRDKYVKGECVYAYMWAYVNMTLQRPISFTQGTLQHGHCKLLQFLKCEICTNCFRNGFTWFILYK